MHFILKTVDVLMSNRQVKLAVRGGPLEMGKGWVGDNSPPKKIPAKENCKKGRKKVLQAVHSSKKFLQVN